jgi:hypothetical protein
MQAVKTKFLQPTVSLDMAYLPGPSAEEIIPLIKTALPGTVRNLELRVYGSKATYTAYAGRPIGSVSTKWAAKDLFDSRSDADTSRLFAKCLHEGGERAVMMPTKEHPRSSLVTWEKSVLMKITCQYNGGEQFKQLFQLVRNE